MESARLETFLKMKCGACCEMIACPVALSRTVPQSTPALGPSTRTMGCFAGIPERHLDRILIGIERPQVPIGNCPGAEHRQGDADHAAASAGTGASSKFRSRVNGRRKLATFVNNSWCCDATIFS